MAYGKYIARLRKKIFIISHIFNMTIDRDKRMRERKAHNELKEPLEVAIVFELQ